MQCTLLQSLANHAGQCLNSKRKFQHRILSDAWQNSSYSGRKQKVEGKAHMSAGEGRSMTPLWQSTWACPVIKCLHIHVAAIYFSLTCRIPREASAGLKLPTSFQTPLSCVIKFKFDLNSNLVMMPHRSYCWQVLHVYPLSCKQLYASTPPASPSSYLSISCWHACNNFLSLHVDAVHRLLHTWAYPLGKVWRDSCWWKAQLLQSFCLSVFVCQDLTFKVRKILCLLTHNFDSSPHKTLKGFWVWNWVGPRIWVVVEACPIAHSTFLGCLRFMFVEGLTSMHVSFVEYCWPFLKGSCRCIFSLSCFQDLPTRGKHSLQIHQVIAAPMQKYWCILLLN